MSKQKVVKQRRCRPVERASFRAGRLWDPEKPDGKLLDIGPDEDVPPYFKEVGLNEEDDRDAGFEADAVLMGDIRKALNQLNPNNGDHWIKDGRPAVAAVEAILGFDVDRGDITKADPNFNQEAQSLNKTSLLD